MIEKFLETIRHRTGSAPSPSEITPGKLTRFATSDKRGDENGWCKLFDDGEGGVFGCWRQGISEAWQAKQLQTPTERTAFLDRVKKSQEEAKRLESEQRAECRRRSAELWEKAQPASRQHPYLVAKNVKPYGIRQLKESLLVPLLDPGRVLHGLQFIRPDGSKKFKTGTAVTGCFHFIGEMQNNTMLIAEGYATGATLHEITGHAVAVGFNAGNLKPLALALRGMLPDTTLIICADNDHATDGNPGITKATEAARAIGGLLAVPTFPATMGAKDTDFNDLAKLAGSGAVKACILAAAHPDTEPEETFAENPCEFWPTPIDMRRLSRTEPEPPRFIVQDWLPCGYAALLAGHGGIGKSGIALMLAVCIASGVPFFGIAVERRKVLYLSCEDRENVLHWRLSRICAYLGISIADLAGKLDILDLVGHDTITFQPGRDRSPLTEAYSALSGRMQQSEVLFVDGISDTYDGNENARAEVKAFVNSLLSLIPPDTGAVVLIGHVSKQPASGAVTSEGYSGSTGWHNSVRSRWYLYPESKIVDDYDTAEQTGKLILKLQKSNLGKSGHSMMFEWEDESHLFVGHEVGDESRFDKNARERDEQDKILATILSCEDYIPAAASGNRTAYHVLSAQQNFPDSLREKPGKKRFWRHIERLRAMGLIMESCITRSDRHKVRVIAPTDKACGHAGNTEN